MHSKRRTGRQKQEGVLLGYMKKGLPKRETKSKNHSRHMEWETEDMGLMIPLFPIFFFGVLFEDVF